MFELSFVGPRFDKSKIQPVDLSRFKEFYKFAFAMICRVWRFCLRVYDGLRQVLFLFSPC